MRKSNNTGGYWSRVLLYFYHFFVIILCITNLIFFAVHFHDYEFNPDNNNTILTFIGFLFAIAAINIYSIFNTNIETEKRQLRQEISNYSRRLKLDMQQSRTTNSMFRFMVIGHLIATSPKLNSQFLEWIAAAKSELKTFKNTLSQLVEHGNFDKFNELYSDVMFLLREERLLLEIFINNLKTDSTKFFDNSKLVKSNNRALNDLIDLKTAIYKLESYDFYTQKEELDFDDNISNLEPPDKLAKRLEDWILASKALIQPKKTRIRVIERM